MDAGTDAGTAAATPYEMIRNTCDYTCESLPYQHVCLAPSATDNSTQLISVQFWDAFSLVLIGEEMRQLIADTPHALCVARASQTYTKCAASPRLQAAS